MSEVGVIVVKRVKYNAVVTGATATANFTRYSPDSKANPLMTTEGGVQTGPQLQPAVILFVLHLFNEVKSKFSKFMAFSGKQEDVLD